MNPELGTFLSSSVTNFRGNCRIHHQVFRPQTARSAACSVSSSRTAARTPTNTVLFFVFLHGWLTSSTKSSTGDNLQYSHTYVNVISSARVLPASLDTLFSSPLNATPKRGVFVHCECGAQTSGASEKQPSRSHTAPAFP